MTALTRWQHTFSTVPVPREGGNKQLGTRGRSGGLGLAATLPHPSGTVRGAAMINFKAKVWCPSRFVVQYAVAGLVALPRGKYTRKGSMCRTRVLTWTRPVLWDRWQVWWFQGPPAGAGMLPRWTWWLQLWPAQAHGAKQTEQRAFPTLETLGKAALGRAAHWSYAGVKPCFPGYHPCQLSNTGFPQVTPKTSTAFHCPRGINRKGIKCVFSLAQQYVLITPAPANSSLPKRTMQCI